MGRATELKIFKTRRRINKNFLSVAMEFSLSLAMEFSLTLTLQNPPASDPVLLDRTRRIGALLLKKDCGTRFGSSFFTEGATVSMFLIF
jgi:hypothetical protein